MRGRRRPHHPFGRPHPSRPPAARRRGSTGPRWRRPTSAASRRSSSASPSRSRRSPSATGSSPSTATGTTPSGSCSVASARRSPSSRSFYVWIVDGHMKEPRDAYWQLGRVLLGHPEDARRSEIANHYRGVAHQGVLPPALRRLHPQPARRDPHLRPVERAVARTRGLSTSLTDLIYALDVLYATVGYILSFRILDTHVRSAEPIDVRLGAWRSSATCRSGASSSAPSTCTTRASAWRRGSPGTWICAWCGRSLIILFELIYLLATFAFGVRFSNLTHRGILTNGPYRYTKHPAYIAKNISWWMIDAALHSAPRLGERREVDASGWRASARSTSCARGPRSGTSRRTRSTSSTRCG